jgi:23S rRNA maturation mini-RNase III
MTDGERIDALEQAVRGDAIFSVAVPSNVLRAIFAELNAAKKVIEHVYMRSNQPVIITETREYLNEYGGAK